MLKASQGTEIFGWDMLFDIPFLADWNKIGDHRQARQTLSRPVKIAYPVIETTKLVIKYFLEKMVSSENQRVGMNVIRELSQQFIQRKGRLLGDSRWKLQELYACKLILGLCHLPPQMVHLW